MDALNSRKRETAGQLRARYDSLSNQAFDVLQDAMQSENENLRLTAARFAIQKRLDLYNQLNTTERLDEIEELARRNGMD